MKTPFHIHPSLRRALRFSLVIEAVVLFLAASIADYGQAWQICYFAFLGFNSFQFSVLLRRALAPTKLDLIVIRAGFMIAIPMTILVTSYVWNLRGL